MSLKKKPVNKSESEDDSDSEHELFFYADNRFKLMQEVLKLIKPKVLQSMTPPCIRELQLSAVKTMLLEELLGISAKRLRYMLEGVNMEVESSSESEQDIKQEMDIISLDDISDNSQISISDDENCMEIQLSQEEQLELDTETNESTSKPITKNGKKAHAAKTPNKIKKKSKPKEKEPVMNVLNLLELQARARAIRSQLAVEVCKKEEPIVETFVQETAKRNGSGDESSSESVIMINPQKTLIVIQDSDEELKETLKETNTDVALVDNLCEHSIEEVASLEKYDTRVGITDKRDVSHFNEQTNGIMDTVEVGVEKTIEVLPGTTAAENVEITNVETSAVVTEAVIDVVIETAIEIVTEAT